MIESVLKADGQFLKQELTCTNSFKIFGILQNILVLLWKYKNNIQKKTRAYELNYFRSDVLRKFYSFACFLEKLDDHSHYSFFNIRNLISLYWIIFCHYSVQFSSGHIFISHIQQKNYSLIKNKIQDLIYR